MDCMLHTFIACNPRDANFFLLGGAVVCDYAFGAIRYVFGHVRVFLYYRHSSHNADEDDQTQMQV